MIGLSIEGQAQVSFVLHDLQQAALSLMQTMEEEEMQIGDACAAAFLAIGTMMAPHELSDDEEMAFVQAMMEFAGVYWGEGEA